MATLSWWGGLRGLGHSGRLGRALRSFGGLGGRGPELRAIIALPSSEEKEEGFRSLRAPWPNADREGKP